jgi:hypothetical protein
LKNQELPFLSIYSSDGMCQSFPLAGFAEVRAAETQAATWRDSGSICSLADAERHLGHIIRAGDYWLAFDATHINETGTGFRLLGCCANVAAAKQAVEQLVLKNECVLAALLVC